MAKMYHVIASIAPDADLFFVLFIYVIHVGLLSWKKFSRGYFIKTYSDRILVGQNISKKNHKKVTFVRPSFLRDKVSKTELGV